MADIEQCRRALEELSGRLAGGGSVQSASAGLRRSMSCTVPDLGVVFSGQLRDGQLVDLTTEPAPRAQIRLTTSSDDLVGLTDGTLSFPAAWSSGRVKIEASILDLLKLRSLL